MTKKHYELIAKVIRQETESYPKHSPEYLAIGFLVSNLAEKLKGDNINFNSDRFFRACGLEE